jgi:S1-C subfamily serine protease
MDERDDSVVSDSGKLWPGFIATPLTDDVRKKGKIPAKVKGVVVADVQEKSPAAALRLQQGDIITAVNDKRISDVSEFYEALNLNEKAEIWFDVYSDGHTISTGHYKVEQ